MKNELHEVVHEVLELHFITLQMIQRIKAKHSNSLKKK